MTIKRRELFKSALALGSLYFMPKIILGAENNKQLPNVLILGDSVSIGYTNLVRKKLSGKATVHRPQDENGKPVNCNGTTFGVKMIDEWLSAGKWDIIHFNFGLHDLKHVLPETRENSTDPNDPQEANLKQYKKNLKQIVKKLIQTDAKLIFATTTPFPDKPDGPYRAADQAKKYNKVALKIMNKNGIRIDDLYGFVLPREQELQLPNNVHFSNAGYAALAEQVAKIILSDIA